MSHTPNDDCTLQGCIKDEEISTKNFCADNSECKLSDPEVAAVCPHHLSQAHRYALLLLLCSAQFFDIFNADSAIIALPQIGDRLSFTPSELQWVASAYTLTFAAFQLSAGRVADIYGPKLVFCVGYLVLGIFGIVCGFSVHPIMLLVCRAVQGIGAAMTIPSALAMIIIMFPESAEQSTALAIFGALGALGGSLGFLIGGVLTSRVSWRWAFWIVAIAAIPSSALGAKLLPKVEVSAINKKHSIDLAGMAVLTAGLILFVYAISDAADAGWASPQILVTLIISIILFVSWFFVEGFVKDPAVPLRVWSNPNFLPLFIYSWSIYWWFIGSLIQLAQVFQDIFHWSPLSSAIHFLPLGVNGLLTTILVDRYGSRFSQKVMLIVGQLGMAAGAVLFALADEPFKYWSHIFPGMIIGTTGLTIGYLGAIIAIMGSCRKGEEGVAGALLNTSFQLGATIGLAVMTSIVLGVNDKLPHASTNFEGYAAAFWSVVGMDGIIACITLLFVQSK